MGFRSLLLWGWRTDAACPEHCGRSDGQSMPSYGERLGGGAVRPLCRGVASSEAEMTYLLEGRFATLERGGDCPAGLRGVRMGHMRGFFESFSFFQMEGCRGPSWAQLP